MRRVRWLGHATVLLELGGVRLLTDPVLRRGVMHLRRQTAVPDTPRELDAVLVSHVHRDHLDVASLRRVAGRSTVVVVPAGAASLVEGFGFAAVHELRAGDSVRIAELDVEAVPAWHRAQRHPGAPVVPSLGYLADRVWFAGDTDLDDGMAALQGRVDVALLPVWGWGPTLGPGHMDPGRAAQAVALVAPATAIPIHWGTYFPLGLARRSTRQLWQPPGAFAAAAAQAAPGTRVTILAPGGRWPAARDDPGR